MKKPRKESVPTSIRLSREEYDRLMKMPGGVASYVKRGMELLAREENIDGPTSHVARLSMEIAREIELEIGAAWHTDAGAYRAFRRALVRALSKWRPAGVPDFTLEPVQVKPFQQRQHASVPLNDADEIGIAIANMVLNTPNPEHRAVLRAAQEQSLRDIVEHQQTRGEGND